MLTTLPNEIILKILLIPNLAEDQKNLLNFASTCKRMLEIVKLTKNIWPSVTYVEQIIEGEEKALHDLCKLGFIKHLKVLGYCANYTMDVIPFIKVYNLIRPLICVIEIEVHTLIGIGLNDFEDRLRNEKKIDRIDYSVNYYHDRFGEIIKKYFIRRRFHCDCQNCKQYFKSLRRNFHCKCSLCQTQEQILRDREIERERERFEDKVRSMYIIKKLKFTL